MATDRQKKDLMVQIEKNDEEIAQLKVLAFESAYQQPEKRTYQQPLKKTLKGILEEEIKEQNKKIKKLMEQIVANDEKLDVFLASTEDPYAEERWVGVW